MSTLNQFSWIKEYQKKNPGLDYRDATVMQKVKEEWEAADRAARVSMDAANPAQKADLKAAKWREINKNGGEAIMGMIVLGLVAYGVVSCVQIKREEANRTPQQIAADQARARQKDLDTKYKALRENAEEVLQNYLLASGKGMCDSLQNVAMGGVRYGTAVYQFAKREPAITGSYKADCVYYLQGEKVVKTQTYWFRLTVQSSTGQREGSILLDNAKEISRGLQATKFQDATS